MVRKIPALIASLSTLLMLLATLLSPLPVLATFTASTDQSVITQNETIDLTLRVDSHSSSGQPDTTSLQQNFDILGNRRNSQFQIINGKTESWTDWVITLAPKRTGAITIPTFTYNGETSKPIYIDVRSGAAAASNNNAVSPIFIKTSLSRQELYVQQETILTLKIYYSVQLVGDSGLTPLVINRAIVHQMGNKQYDELINGQRYNVFEVQYAIHPQESGTLTVPALIFTSTVIAGGDPYSGFFTRQRTKPIRAASTNIILDVRPIPADYPANVPWLPASNLTLTQTWSSNPDNLNAGDPVTRTITVEAKGLTAAQLPPITMPSVVGMKIYPDQAKTEDTSGPDGIIGQRTEAVAFVPTQSGKVTLPASHYTWFNTTTGKVETATLPETIINVATSTTTSITTPTPSLPIDSETLSDSAPQSGLSPTHQATLPWIIATVAFTLLWLATLGFYLKHRKVTANPVSHTHHTIDKTEYPTEKSAFHQLSEACKKSDVQQIKHQFMDWAALFLNRDDLYRLAAVSQLFHHDELTQQLESLEQALYSGQSGHAFNSDSLLEIIADLRKLTKSSRKRSDDAVLSPINP
ncbi:MAG: protein BatD [Endozoicomonadaceae bacterium]|nr:protein BatD [Endozoicomonadaceae bacterium]